MDGWIRLGPVAGAVAALAILASSVAAVERPCDLPARTSDGSEQVLTPTSVVVSPATNPAKPRAAVANAARRLSSALVRLASAPPPEPKRDMSLYGTPAYHWGSFGADPRPLPGTQSGYFDDAHQITFRRGE